MQTDYANHLFGWGMAAVLFVPIMLLVWAVAIYNRLVALRNSIPESWSNIDTELRRRYDLIPNLVETVKAYAAHERAIFDTVASTRAQAMSATKGAEQKAHDENGLVRALQSLLAVTEAYPNLKADRNFLELQHELTNTEDRIQAARRFYNGNVRDYNNLVQCFPSNILASLFGFTKAQYFEIEELFVRALTQVSFQS